MRPVPTIGQVLPSVKDPHTEEKKTCLIDSVPCSNCECVYIRQTKYNLKSRLAEHKRAVRY